MEEYLSMKFDQVKEQLTAIERRLDGLDQRVEQTEHDSLNVQKRLRQLESRADATTGR